jgi:CBS domain-containing protein
MTIANIALKPVQCVTLETALLEVARAMSGGCITNLPVCDGGSYVGMVDVGDILGLVAPAGLPNLKFAGDMLGMVASHARDLAKKQVKEVVVRDIPALPENCPLLEAAHLLSKHDRPLAVVDGAGKVTGMLSSCDMLSHVLTQAGL